MIPTIYGGLEATTADDGVSATTSTSCLWAMVAEQTMALAFNGGVATMAIDGRVAVTEASNNC